MIYILMLQRRSSDKGKGASQILIYYLITGSSVCVCVWVWEQFDRGTVTWRMGIFPGAGKNVGPCLPHLVFI